jgi:hypothetical protein
MARISFADLRICIYLSWVKIASPSMCQSTVADWNFLLPSRLRNGQKGSKNLFPHHPGQSTAAAASYGQLNPIYPGNAMHSVGLRHPTPRQLTTSWREVKSSFILRLAHMSLAMLTAAVSSSPKPMGSTSR